MRYARGTALHTIGEYERALAAYSSALELDPTRVKAAQWRGYTRDLLGRHAAAVEDYTRALAILEDADEERLAEWGGSRSELVRWTLRARAAARDGLGEHEAAERDRERAQ